MVEKPAESKRNESRDCDVKPEKKCSGTKNKNKYAISSHFQLGVKLAERGPLQGPTQILAPRHSPIPISFS